MNITVENNAKLTDQKISIEARSNYNRDHLNATPMGLDQEIQRNSLVKLIEPLYSTTFISASLQSYDSKGRVINVASYTGTGFFVVDRSKDFTGKFESQNINVSNSYRAIGKFPRTYIVSNKHVLDNDIMSLDRSKWEIESFTFTFHLVKYKKVNDNFGISFTSGIFKILKVTIPTSQLRLQKLLDRDLSAIDTENIFNEIQRHINSNAELQGYELFYHAFDCYESFMDRKLPMRSSVETVGYSLSYVSDDYCPDLCRGIITSLTSGVDNDGKCQLDIPSGSSGSPIYCANSRKLIGVAFVSANESTHRLAYIIKHEYVIELLELFV
mmetsp:Transcript_11476/g.10405  ORF Transcript_11476/g.10405 Transcript_11476/m.10405 type:complete len:327 (-) Transcript_11476:100-1080(-)